MRMHGAVWVGSFVLAMASTITVPWAQTMPSAGVNAIEQGTPEYPSSLLPAFGLTLDGPSSILEQPRETDGNDPRPSDGLSLQMYDIRLPAPAGNGEGDHDAQGNRNQ